MTDEELAWWRERCTPRRITAEAKRYCADVPAREVAALLTALEQARADIAAALKREQILRNGLKMIDCHICGTAGTISSPSGKRQTCPLCNGSGQHWKATLLLTAAPAPTPEPSLREELFATTDGGREVHRSWRDHMLAQSRDVAEQRMTWETLDPLDHALDNAIALDVIRCWLRWTGAPGPTSPEPEPGEPAG
jgi:hypothetical protein